LGNGDAGIKDFCAREGIPVLMTVPFDRKIAEAYSRGQTILEAFPVYRSAFLSLFENIKRLLS
jgi:MinD superfamily P-loop ATPase